MWLIKGVIEEELASCGGSIEYRFEDASLRCKKVLSALSPTISANALVTLPGGKGFEIGECITLPEWIEERDIRHASGSHELGLLPYKIALKKTLLQKVYARLLDSPLET